jgi:hypothetical protein
MLLDEEERTENGFLYSFSVAPRPSKEEFSFF